MGCIFDEVVYCFIINMYGKVGLYEEVEKVFKEMVELGFLFYEKIYIFMVKVRVDVGWYEEVLKIFNLMVEKGVFMIWMVWNIFLYCFVGVGDVE